MQKQYNTETWIRNIGKIKNNFERNIKLQKFKVKVLNYKDEGYPNKLLKIKQYPKNLYIIGNEKILNNDSIAIVGSRDATEYGLKNAQRFSNAFSYVGITVVSGLAVRNRYNGS